MSNYKERIKQELSDLEEKIAKAQIFIDDTDSGKLDECQHGLLSAQILIMRSYAAILKQRLITDY